MNEQTMKVRDELAKEYALLKYPVQNIETSERFTQDVNFARRLASTQFFQEGFTCGYEEAQQEIAALKAELIAARDTIKFMANFPTWVSEKKQNIILTYEQCVGAKKEALSRIDKFLKEVGNE